MEYLEFQNIAKKSFENFVGEAVDELKDGFKEGEKDVFEWVKVNLQRFNNS